MSANKMMDRLLDNPNIDPTNKMFALAAALIAQAIGVHAKAVRDAAYINQGRK